MYVSKIRKKRLKLQQPKNNFNPKLRVRLKPCSLFILLIILYFILINIVKFLLQLYCSIINIVKFLLQLYCSIYLFCCQYFFIGFWRKFYFIFSFFVQCFSRFLLLFSILCNKIKIVKYILMKKIKIKYINL